MVRPHHTGPNKPTYMHTPTNSWQCLSCSPSGFSHVTMPTGVTPDGHVDADEGDEGYANSDRRRRTQGEEEEDQGGDSHAKAVAALPSSICSPARPRSLCGGGVGVSPAGNHFWPGMIPTRRLRFVGFYKFGFPSKYLHSPSRSSEVGIASFNSRWRKTKI